MISPLATVQIMSPNHSGKRNHKIDTITIHCMAGDLSAENCGYYFQAASTKASSNYGVDSNGVIACYVDEDNRSWATSSASNDNRAVTIEVANRPAKAPWKVTDKAWDSVVALVTDICERNGITELKWKNDKSLIGKPEDQNMTVHRWFANKDCPGEYLMGRMADIADEVNTNMKGEDEDLKRYNSVEEMKDPFKTVTDDLIKCSVIKGGSAGLDLSEDMLRVLVFNYRAGCYDSALKLNSIERKNI